MRDDGGLHYVPPLSGRAVWWLGGRGVFAATGDDTGGAFCWWEDTPPPGGGPVPHVHSREEEFFYVLEGELDYEAAGRPFHATPGSLVGLPRGVPHRFRNGPAWARLLVFVAPAGNERFFLELAADDRSPEDPTAEPDPSRFAEAAARAGVTLLAPDDPDWATRRLPAGEGRIPFTRAPGEGERLVRSGAAVVLKATGAETGGAYTLAEVELAPGAALPARHHPEHAAGVYVLEGTPTLRSGAHEVRASAGGSAVLRRGSPYEVRNASRYPARLLWVACPAGPEEELPELADPGRREDADGR